DRHARMLTHEDKVRADEPHRNGVLRITIACTGVAAARFPLCLHVKSRHLGDAYRYPTRHSDLCPTGTPNELRDSNANSIHRTSTVLSRRAYGRCCLLCNDRATCGWSQFRFRCYGLGTLGLH
ncbi:hypothetical protein, partial [Rubripirellula obstinata]|uniref:hypothetical protein n=1 Tax=Rubripirellula obstinata TaxID=406547 RepID=UPI001EE42052